MYFPHTYFVFYSIAIDLDILALRCLYVVSNIVVNFHRRKTPERVTAMKSSPRVSMVSSLYKCACCIGRDYRDELHQITSRPCATAWEPEVDLFGSYITTLHNHVSSPLWHHRKELLGCAAEPNRRKQNIEQLLCSIKSLVTKTCDTDAPRERERKRYSTSSLRCSLGTRRCAESALPLAD